MAEDVPDILFNAAFRAWRRSDELDTEGRLEEAIAAVLPEHEKQLQAEAERLQAELAEAREAYLAVIEAAELRGTVRVLQAERDALKAAIETMRNALDFLDGAATGLREVYGPAAERGLRGVLLDARQKLDAALAVPETPGAEEAHVDRHGREWDHHPFAQGRFKDYGVCMCDQMLKHPIHVPETPGDADG